MKKHHNHNNLRPLRTESDIRTGRAFIIRPITEELPGSPFDIRNLKVHASPLHNPRTFTDELKADELELIESVLIGKYLEEVKPPNRTTKTG